MVEKRRVLARKLDKPTGKPCVMIQPTHFGSRVKIKQHAATGGYWGEPMFHSDSPGWKKASYA